MRLGARLRRHLRVAYSTADASDDASDCPLEAWNI